MSSIIHRRCLTNLMTPKYLGQTYQKRFNRREQIHKYYEPSRFKKHMLAYTEPYYKRNIAPPSETCMGYQPKVHELLPISKIYADELEETVNQSEFVLFIQHNYIPARVERPSRNTITKSGGEFISHKNVVLKEVFCNRLGYEKLNHLFIIRNSLVVGPLDRLGACVLAINKISQFLLLAGLIEKELIFHDQLQAIAVQPSLDSARASLVATLETPAQDLVYNLEQHSKSLPEDEPKVDMNEVE